MSKLRPIVEST